MKKDHGEWKNVKNHKKQWTKETLQERSSYINKNIAHSQGKGTLIKSAWCDFWVAMDYGVLGFPQSSRIQMGMFIVVIMALFFSCIWGMRTAEVEIVFPFTDLQIKGKQIQTNIENYVYHLEILILQAWCCLAGILGMGSLWSGWVYFVVKTVIQIFGWPERQTCQCCLPNHFFFFAFWSYGRIVSLGPFIVS